MKYGLSPRKFPRAQPEGTSIRWCVQPSQKKLSKYLTFLFWFSSSNVFDTLLIIHRNGIMSVLGLESGYPMKHGLSPRKFPRASPSGTSLGSGHIS